MLQGLEAMGSERLWPAYRSVLKDRVQVLPVDIREAEHYARAGGCRGCIDVAAGAGIG